MGLFYSTLSRIAHPTRYHINHTLDQFIDLFLAVAKSFDVMVVLPAPVTGRSVEAFTWHAACARSKNVSVIVIRTTDHHVYGHFRDVLLDFDFVCDGPSELERLRFLSFVTLAVDTRRLLAPLCVCRSEDDDEWNSFRWRSSWWCLEDDDLDVLPDKDLCLCR